MSVLTVFKNYELKTEDFRSCVRILLQKLWMPKFFQGFCGPYRISLDVL